jgi:RNA polymerase sigma-70 factor (ECF subfamily)
VQVAAVSRREDRLKRMFEDNFRLIWRLVRRLGLPETAADDATQQVFLIAAERLDDIVLGSERAFAFGTALRVARTAQRKAGREALTDTSDLERSLLPSPDDLADQKRARDMLDSVLERMPEDLRTTFILFELEGLKTREIADVAGIPLGTVASRLRRARELFHVFVKEATDSASLRGGVS